MVSHCLARTTAGGRCQAQPVRPSGYCYWHDPAIAEERDRKRREGGTNRSNKARAKKHLPAEPLTADEVRAYLGIVFKGVIGGTIDPGVGTAAANIARAIVQVAGVADIEAQIADLRDRIEGKAS